MRTTLPTGCRAGLALLACLAFCGPAMADKPSWAGQGKHGHDRADEQRPRGEREGRDGHARIGGRERDIIFDYYRAQERAGHCPPGLAKKHNGCLPPGQAKKWALGQPLPAGVGYHELPHDLLVRLPPPPAGHRYVQVAADVLLIAVGTGMVADAVQDLMR